MTHAAVRDDDDDGQTLGNWLARLRGNSGLSQQHVAERLSVDRRQVSRWENDESVMSGSTLLRYLHVVGAEVSPPVPGQQETLEQRVARVESRLESVEASLDGVLGQMRANGDLVSRALDTQTQALQQLAASVERIGEAPRKKQPRRAG